MAANSAKTTLLNSKFLFAVTLNFLSSLVKITHGGCPFQNPFWFVEKPVVVSVFDENGEMVANKIRVMWGRMENFKCVDYFQVEYFQRLNPAQTVTMTPRINRHRRSVEIEVTPCTDYYFKVIASEDWKGLREDFKVFSEVVGYRNRYTPKFVKPPIVKERGKRNGRIDPRTGRPRRPKPQPQTTTDPSASGQPPTEPPPQNFNIKVGWRLSDLDFPICLDYFVMDYYDTLYNESSWSKTFQRPFMRPKFELEIANTVVPCEPDYEFRIYAFGLNKKFTQSVWTPPSCIVTTPAPTTTEAVISTVSVGVAPTTESLSEKMEILQAENDKLQAKIDGLKQEYEKIGLQVFLAFQDHFWTGLEDFIARRKAGGDTAAPAGNGTDPMFG